MPSSRSALFAILLATGAPALPAEELLTLEDAVAIALEGNHRLGSAAAVRDAAEASVDEAESDRQPRVGLTEAFSWTTNPALVFANLLGQEDFTQSDFDVDLLNDPDALTNWNTALFVKYPLYSGGRVDGSVGSSRAALDAAEGRLERTRQEVVLEVIDRFSSAVLAQARLGVATEALETSGANLELVSDLYDGGLVVESDLLRARVRQSEIEEKVIRARAEIEISRARLNFALGRELDTPFLLPESLASERNEAPDSLEELLVAAVARRPDLHAAESQVAAAEQATRVARSGRRPDVGIEGRYEANARDFIGAEGTNWSIFVGANIPLFEGRRTRSRVAGAEALRRQAESAREELAQTVELETRRAWHEVRSARQSLELSREAVKLARASLRIVQDRYREGLTTLVELLDAETSLTEARTREVATIRSLLVSHAELDLAVGRL